MKPTIKAPLYGALFALSAAALNATIGTFSKVLMQHGLSPGTIAFSKTMIGALILVLLMPFLKMTSPRSKWYQVAICAFFGIFAMYMFETQAYAHDSAANVVVALMASACITTIVLGYFFLGEKINAATVIGALLAIAGLSVILGVKFNSGFNATGTILAICAGTGYGLFSIFMKKTGLQGGLILTRQLLIYGSVFLFVPVAIEQPAPFDLSYIVIGCLLGLAILPTILGFYCTTKAIQYLTPSKVQILELSEPVFAALMALVFLRELPGLSTWIGGTIIILGISIANGLLRLPVRTRSSVSAV
ncbi:DMT family transporter [Pseudomonas sp. EA_5y_Pfl2_R50]|uniref:DMT family transporter n=1 Tax=Pseudomonas sp. EA_5y_Pfl2_R50 TaxID=3088691 RepID=UPI0030D876A1